MRYHVAIILTAILPAPLLAEPLFDPMFQDHAVLQRDKPAAVWGKAEPNEAVMVRWGDAAAQATADANGAWRVTLPPRSAGHSGDLSVNNGNGQGQTVKDVVAGDVWLCSGQSNMEMAVERGLNSYSELQDADHPDIRLFQLGHATAAEPQADFGDTPVWRLANAESVAGFSAACFFMAKQLRKSHPVPMGLIHSSWGGTAINTWRSGMSLSTDAAGKDATALLAIWARDKPKAERLWGDRWISWWNKIEKGNPAAGRLLNAMPVPKLTNWEKWGVPDLESYDGQMWLQAEIELSKEEALSAQMLELGTIDDLDQSWVNGIGVGNSFGLWRSRSYPLATGTLRAGSNLITIHVTDKWGRAGGLTGDPEKIGIKLKNGTLLPLRKWTYRTEANRKEPPPAPWDSHWGVSTVSNAMVAPVQPYTLKGVAWYQGESDIGTNPPYRQKLAALMQDWRAGFANPDLPFLIVQLSDFGPPSGQPVNSGWAAQREEQRQAVLADARSALIITRDLGDRYDIHPANKQMVGQRLATAARAVAYGEKIAPSGPEIAEARQTADVLTLRFRNVGGKLLGYSSERAIGFEICRENSVCGYADATVNGDTVTLANPATNIITHVRYCWADSAICNLFDSSDKPVGPFEIAVNR
jgi:sialate O-acetylesterase